MDGFTIIDGVVAIVVVLSAVLAYSRGFVREVLSIGGWVVAAVAAYFIAPYIEPLMHEIPVLNEFLDSSCELGMIPAFFIAFAVALVLVSVIAPLFAGAVQRSALGGLDMGLGFLFGALRGALLVAIAFLVYERVVVSDPIPMVDDSRTSVIFSQVSESISDNIPEDAPGWFQARYDELLGKCSVQN